MKRFNKYTGLMIASILMGSVLSSGAIAAEEAKKSSETVKAEANKEIDEKFKSNVTVNYKVNNEEKQIQLASIIIPDEAKNETVAKVGDIEIKDAEVRAAYMSTPYRFQGQTIDTVYEALLERLIEQKTISTAAKKEGLDKKPLIESQMALAAEGILSDTYIFDKVEQATTPEALKKRYADFIKDYKPEEEVHARHILVKSEEEAKKAYERVVDKKEDFVKVAKELSAGMPGGENGGDLGYFTQNRMVKPFAEAAFAMKKGEISKPVKTQFGWHVIKVEDKRQKEAPKFADTEIRLKGEIASETVKDLMDKLKKETKSEILLKKEIKSSSDKVESVKPEEKSADKAEAKPAEKVEEKKEEKK